MQENRAGNLLAGARLKKQLTQVELAIRIIDHDVPGVVRECVLVRSGQAGQAVAPVVDLGFYRDQARREIVVAGLPGS